MEYSDLSLLGAFFSLVMPDHRLIFYQQMCLTSSQELCRYPDKVVIICKKGIIYLENMQRVSYDKGEPCR